MTNDTPPPTDTPSSFPDDMAQYLQVYIDESEEELEGLIDAILILEGNPADADSLNKAFRMLHSLKGSSGMLGFEVVGNFAHELEDRFERYRSGETKLTRETTTLVLKCVDYLRSFLERLRVGDLTQGDPTPYLQQLQSLEQRPSAPAATASSSTMSASPTMTVSGGITILIRFRPGLQLADLKARLIVSRLSSIGEIISCDPPIDDVQSFDDLPLFSLTLVSDRNVDEIRKIANVDGVESIEFQGSELTHTMLTSTAALKGSTPVATPVATPLSAPEATTAAVAPQVDVVESDEPESTRSSSATSEPESTDAKVSVSETLRIDIGRLDHLMNLTGELVVANARFGQITGEMGQIFRHSGNFKKSKELADRLRQRFEQCLQLASDSENRVDQWARIAQGLDEDLEGLDRQAEFLAQGFRHFGDLNDAVDQLTRVSKNLQRGVLDTRMVPVGPLFNRFKRVIRDLSVERHKQVHLSIHGEKTELDKRMIDALGDPLLHLVRNAIDHGLESTEQRRAAGKTEVGTISLEAAHRGNSVWITVRDDGGGISADKIRARIKERGLASATQVRELTDAQAIDYIWHPGFSTAEAVTEISGRGVGMDIVRSTIASLSGTIDVASTLGVGTTFTIHLPLTLAIIHSLMMRFRNDHFSIPIDDVREIVSIPRDQVHSVHRHVAIDVRGELIPLVSMKGVFQWAQQRGSLEPMIATGPDDMINVVVIQSRGKILGLAVDSLVGRADLVIKSLTENFQPVRGLSGASILGDGAVCLMIDSAALVDLASERSLAGAAY